MRLIYFGYFIQIKIWLINSKFNKKKEQQNLKNSIEDKNGTSNDNSNSTPYQDTDNISKLIEKFFDFLFFFTKKNFF